MSPSWDTDSAFELNDVPRFTTRNSVFQRS